MISNGSWLDVLEPRRDTSDLIWLIFHDWNSEKYAYSKNRDPKEIRDAVYNEPYIRVGTFKCYPRINCSFLDSA